MNIEHTPREANQKIANYIKESIKKMESLDYSIDESFNESDLAQVLREDLPGAFENDNKNTLIFDICKITSAFLNGTQGKNVRLQLMVVTTNKCRFFHVDNNIQRLLCTYSGPGTEWLEEDNINREWLAHGMNDKVVKDKNKVRESKNFDLLLLKGKKYSLDCKGAVHRSPEIKNNNNTRVLLKIDEINVNNNVLN